MKKFLIAAATTVAMVALPITPLLLPQVAAAQWVEVHVRPPEMRVETQPPAPSPGYVWVPGYWNWNGHRNVWVSGMWTMPRHQGWGWHQPVWQQHGHGWRYQRGHWGNDGGDRGGPGFHGGEHGGPGGPGGPGGGYRGGGRGGH